MVIIGRSIVAGVSLLVLSYGSVCTANSKEDAGEADNIPYGRMLPELVEVAYSGTEKITYAISWTGGVKLGELFLDIHPFEDGYEMDAVVSTKGSFMDNIYPVHDIHATKVRGEMRLPYHYEVWQEEGRNYKAHRVTTYDQQKGLITYRKNDQPEREFRIEGKAHNEFSAFFASRLMNFDDDGAIKVPTFADKKRVEVVVKTLDRPVLEETALGTVSTVLVSPILKFKGLYDKRGDTVIWYTDDECRVPVRINSKIAIGSITATLIDYENPLCPRYHADGLLSDRGGQ